MKVILPMAVQTHMATSVPNSYCRCPYHILIFHARTKLIFSMPVPNSYFLWPYQSHIAYVRTKFIFSMPVPN